VLPDFREKTITRRSGAISLILKVKWNERVFSLNFLWAIEREKRHGFVKTACFSFSAAASASLSLRALRSQYQAIQTLIS